jgi:hypothetical protein
MQRVAARKAAQQAAAQNPESLPADPETSRNE